MDAIQNGLRGTQQMRQAIERTTQVAQGMNENPILDKVTLGASWLTDPANHGNTIGVDRGSGFYHFGYGEHGDTVGDFAWTPYKNELTGEEGGVKGRAFGRLDPDRLQAMAGLEGQAGWERKQDPAPGYHNEWFAGLRGRAFGEAGPLGVSAGAMGSLGLHGEGSVGGPSGSHPLDQAQIRWQADAGTNAALFAHAGVTGMEVLAHEELGLRGILQFDESQHITDEVAAVRHIKAEGFAGCSADARANLGPTGAGAYGGGFAGMRGSLTESLGLSYQGQELGGAYLKEEAWVGVGAEAGAHAGIDWEKRTIGASAEAGLAMGVGGKLGAGVTIGGEGVGVSQGGASDERSESSEKNAW